MNHRTFRYIGKMQSFKIPKNVTEVFVVAIGGEGGGRRVAHGGRISAILPVAPGETLYIRVAGNGTATAGGYNGGGEPGMYRGHSYAFGGGGASDVRLGGISLKKRILVAGGGGGRGGDFTSTTRYGDGGKGGNTTGGNGGWGCCGYYSECPVQAGCGGAGGSQTHGGQGGRGGQSDYCYYAASGLNGSLGHGGDGASSTSGRSSDYCDGLGGGGGGGYYGGGGGGEGAGGTDFTSGGGGGGGGSSYAEASATNVHMWRGWSKGEYGLIVLSW